MDKFKFLPKHIKNIAGALKKDGFMLFQHPAFDVYQLPLNELFALSYREMEMYSFVDHYANIELGYQLRVLDNEKDHKIFFHYPANLPNYVKERRYLNDFLSKRINNFSYLYVKAICKEMTELGDKLLAELVPCCDYEAWEQGQNILRFLYYPAANEMAKAHTDRDGLTIIPYSREGLQIKEDGKWMEVPVGTMVFMVGDKLAAELGIPACEHRVIGEERDRYSTVFFYDKQLSLVQTTLNGMIAVGGKL